MRKIAIIALLALSSIACGSAGISIKNIPTPRKIEGAEKKAYFVGEKLWKFSATVLSEECQAGKATKPECDGWSAKVETYRHSALCFHQLFLGGTNSEQNCGAPVKLVLYAEMYDAVSSIFSDAVRVMNEVK